MAGEVVSVELPAEGQVVEVMVGADPVAIGRCGGRLFALDGYCPHAGGMLTDVGPLGGPVDFWHHGYLFAPALTVGGGTGDVQRNIVAERVLGLPHDIDVEEGRTWAESRRTAPA